MEIDGGCPGCRGKYGSVQRRTRDGWMDAAVTTLWFMTELVFIAVVLPADDMKLLRANCGFFSPWGFLLRQIKCSKCSLWSLSRVCSNVVCLWTALHHCNKQQLQLFFFPFKITRPSCLWFACQLRESKNKQKTDRIIRKKNPTLWKKYFQKWVG